MTINIIKALIARIEGYFQGILGTNWTTYKPQIVQFGQDSTLMLLFVAKNTITGKLTAEDAKEALLIQLQAVFSQLQTIELEGAELVVRATADIQQMFADLISNATPVAG